MIVFWLSIAIILAFVCVIFYQTLKKNAVQKEENADLKFYKAVICKTSNPHFLFFGQHFFSVFDKK